MGLHSDQALDSTRLRLVSRGSAGGRPHVVIVGAGFGGLTAAKRLAKAAVEVTLIDRENHHLFQPLLYQVATASLSPAEIAWPIRGLLRRQRNTRVLLGEVTGIDRERHVVNMDGREIPYDFLVLATGATHAYFGNDGWVVHAPGLKSIDDATEIRCRLLLAFERAEMENDPEERQRLLTIVIVGGGPTGVEMAGAITELARKALAADFRNIDPKHTRVLLIEAGPRLLPTFPEDLSRYAGRALRSLGVEVWLGRAITGCDAAGVTLSEERLPADTVIWAAGVAASPAAAWLGVEADCAGRVKVGARLTPPGSDDVFVIGDTALALDANGKPLPGLAPVAKQQGVYVTEVIKARLAGKTDAPPFRYRDRGKLATIGRRAAIIAFGRLRLKGWLAWWIWGIAHIYFLISLRNRLIVATQWLWSYVTFERGARLITGMNPNPDADARLLFRDSADPGSPAAQGLYDPALDKDSCGVGFIADIKGRKSHKIVQDGLTILLNLEHRGAVGADPRMGDGAGILVQIPHKFFAKKTAKLGLKLPPPGQYAIGYLFLPRDGEWRQIIRDIYAEVIARDGLTLLGWRDVPTDNSTLGASVIPTEPVHQQVFIGLGKKKLSEDEFERRLYILRKSISNAIYTRRERRVSGYYPVSISCRTVIYKGMFLADQLGTYYPDLHDPDFESALALVHQRFSTNTFPTWSLAHPYRMIAHNGEINTLRGNVNWMAARQASVSSERFGPDINKLWPISYEGQSDTACFDNALEFLVQGGYSLAHAMMMMIPEAWAGNPLMDEERRAFYEYNAALMEPWDGPAAIAFTNGRQIGATLDRNGLRPARYLLTRDDRIILASEVGVLPIPERDIVCKWRLQPGKMLLVDLDEGRVISDEELKSTLARSHPYKEWLRRTQIVLEDLPPVHGKAARSNLSLLDRQQTFGYTQEDLKLLMEPMVVTAEEAVGSMGTDTPISALSDKAKLLFTYFKQNFAQVTNPPIDPIREELVMSLVSIIGPRPNLFDLEGVSRTKRLEVRQPILTNADLEKIRSISEVSNSHFKSRTFDTTFPVEHGVTGMEWAIDQICDRAEEAVREDCNIIILSDRKAGAERIPIPSLLACAAVHHHLIRKGLRTSVGLVVETAEPREVHHFACLAGYGAEAINPYLAFETLVAMKDELPQKLDEKEVLKRYIKSIDKGLLKVMSKMGISTYQSYCGAQIFDAVGLKADFVGKYFTGTATRIEGVGLEEIAEEAVRRHRDAFGDSPVYRTALDVGGEYQLRVRGEDHAWTASTVAGLQHAVRGNSLDHYRAYAKQLNEQSEHLLTIRGLFRIKAADEDGRKPIPIEEVEPAKEIVKRFSTGAMSFGSISREAHTTLAIAMNRIGGKSNTGEGGEEVDRFKPLPNGDSMRSAIKQVASGRFGVTAEYLVNSDMMQIKMAQGAKPGEGGQLPGHKVDKTIAKVRYSMPGVGLISPPPHHDIYSIEDLAQLIFDLKNVNPEGLVSVKLVSEVGVGTVAAGVSKARADHVTIAGFEGGTGASPLTSIKHAGSPWEIGLAETHQTLVANRLRGRISVQVDGGMRTGRDVIVGALLGADEFGFSTAPLIAAGCIMMRVCHLNTCPVGVATQDPVLRKRFKGQPEHVINYFFFVAEEVRELMAAMGYRRFDEMIGQTQMLDQRKLVAHWKAKGLDFSRLFHKPAALAGVHIYKCEPQDHKIHDILDRKLIAQAQPALERGTPVKIEAAIKNTDRTAGAMLSGEVAKRYGHPGLPDDTITVKLKGTAGQSFGAWLAHGVTFELEGDANDYVGKGISGGKLIIRPPADTGVVPEESIIVGNTVLYGAIAGECYFRGVAGERFAVRNSGANVVVEGAGDHCCEYMTGGVVVVLGRTGRNFAAGMSGGIAYVLDEDGSFATRCNRGMVELQEMPEWIEGEMHGDLTDMTRYDCERLHHLISNHARYAGSERAKEILARWREYLPKFRKVMPLEFSRALAEMEKARTMQAAE